MPLYDYRCEACGHRFQARHGFDADAPACPNCAAPEVKRVILSAPTFAQGILTLAGDSRGATKEQLQDKWAEETPKLRKKLVDKLGEDVVSRNAPTLNAKYD
ncbi:MAG: zinc ribbon domain-containing protein [Chloroflexi bacterium]|nr:zinc ribbon domain-containing protein [Chloroflexota bacterium]